MGIWHVLVTHCEDMKHALCEKDVVVVQSWTFYCQIQQDLSHTGRLHPASPSCVISLQSPSRTPRQGSGRLTCMWKT